MLKYGVVQGRFSPQVGDFIQNFPENWFEEFVLAREFGVSHIEWIDGAPNQNYSVLTSLTEVPPITPISAVCLDGLVKLDLQRIDQINEYITLIANKAKDLKIKKIVLPLLEFSSLNKSKNTKKYNQFRELLSGLSKSYSELTFSIETDLNFYDLEKFLKDLEKVKITFDTGNLTKLGYSLHAHYNEYSTLIDNVHIKDCKVFGSTVKLGTGDVDFTIFHKLFNTKNIEYMTFQTARSHKNEIETFKHNVNMINQYAC